MVAIRSPPETSINKDAIATNSYTLLFFKNKVALALSSQVGLLRYRMVYNSSFCSQLSVAYVVTLQYLSFLDYLLPM